MNLSEAWRARGLGVEFEQALLRVVIGTIVALGVVWSGRVDHAVLAFVAGCLVVAFGILTATWTWPAPSVWRPVLGIAADVVAISGALSFMGAWGPEFVGLYFFIIFGAGFRFGRMYFYVAQLLSVAGFAFCIFNVPWWRSEPIAAIGWIIAMVFIPLYVGVFVERLKAGLTRPRSDVAPTADA